MTPHSPYTPAQKPTFYFIGVTTHQSSIMQVFPQWAKHLGLGDVAMAGMNFAPNSNPAQYREAVAFIKHDPLSLGALITTHKLDLFAASHNLFDEIDPLAELLCESSCISKRDTRLICHAKDPITSGLAINQFLPHAHFANTGAALFAIGAGGASTAITWHILQKLHGPNRPAQIVISDRSQTRLDHIRHFHSQLKADIPITYVLTPAASDNDRILAGLPTGSCVINATGLGKDAPGSPLSDDCEFPPNAVVWELNYRGNLVFLDQAQRQRAAKHLQIENGWRYFIYGWTRVMAEVFDIDIAIDGPQFEQLSDIAIAATQSTPPAP